jgi:hypothetical protein
VLCALEQEQITPVESVLVLALDSPPKKWHGRVQRAQIINANPLGLSAMPAGSSGVSAFRASGGVMAMGFGHGSLKGRFFGAGSPPFARLIPPKKGQEAAWKSSDNKRTPTGAISWVGGACLPCLWRDHRV